MKNLYIYLALAILAGGGVWYATQGGSTNTDTPATEEQQEETASKGTLKSLLAMTTPQQCTFEDENSSGTAYIASNRIRVDATTQVSGKAETSHIITKNNTGYIWMDGQAQGMLITDIDKNSDTGGSSAMNLEEEVDYDCKSWRVDETKFREPTGVTFTDLSEMLKSLQTNPAGVDMKQFGL